MRRRVSSRLNRTSEKQNKRQAFLFTAGFILLIVALFQFGPFFINVFGNLVFSIRGDGREDTHLIGQEVLSPPILIDVQEATQSAYMNISGTISQSEAIVEVYLNDELYKEIKVADDNTFEIKNMVLKSGYNSVKARTVKDEKTSAFSKDYSITYIKDKPKLEVSVPSNNQTFTKADKTITVTGNTDADNSVTINGFKAIVESGGKFTYALSLNDGDNTVVIEAINPAGTAERRELKVTYTP